MHIFNEKLTTHIEDADSAFAAVEADLEKKIEGMQRIETHVKGNIRIIEKVIKTEVKKNIQQIEQNMKNIEKVIEYNAERNTKEIKQIKIKSEIFNHKL